MASGSPRRSIASLIILAAKTRVISRNVCGGHSQIMLEAKNLYGVLKRLQQEAIREGSALTRSGSTCRGELMTLCCEVRRILSDTHAFLPAYQTLGHYEANILGFWNSASVAHSTIINHFAREIKQYSLQLSHLLIEAALDKLSGQHQDMDLETGIPLSKILNGLTARLLAEYNVRFSMIVEDPRNEQILWDSFRTELLEKKIDDGLLNLHKKRILKYVKAIERRSSLSSCSNVAGHGIAKTPVKTAAKDSNTAHGISRNDLAASPNFKKRARPVEEVPPEPPQGSNETPSQSFLSDRAPKRFKARDPKLVFGPEVDDDRLADFLEEDPTPSQQNRLRNQLRNIYRTLDENQYLRYEIRMFQDINKLAKDEKEFKALPWELEHVIVKKLDELELGSHSDLRDLRRMMIKKVQKMLGDLDAVDKKR